MVHASAILLDEVGFEIGEACRLLQSVFEAVESVLNMRRSDPVRQSDDPMADAAKPTQRRTPPPSAPVSRSSAGPGTRPNTVRLTSQEREMASMMGMTVEEYAKNKLALQKEGKLN